MATSKISFELQDRITESVIGSVGPVLRGAEIERARRKPEASQDVYDLTCRALLPAFAETAQDNAEALRVLCEALEIDPAYASANALAAWCHQQRHLMDWPGGKDDDRETAKGMARVAIVEGTDVPLALAVGGAVRAALTRDHDSALAAVDRATMISPNSAVVLGFDALTRCLCGAYDKAIEHAEKAIRLSPLEPLIYHAAFALALACLLTDRHEEAVTHARKAIDGNRNFAFPYCVLALSYARLGQPDEAREVVRRLMGAAPSFRIGAPQDSVCRCGTPAAPPRSAARGPPVRLTLHCPLAQVRLTFLRPQPVLGEYFVKIRARVTCFTHSRRKADHICRMLDRCTAGMSDDGRERARRRLAAILFVGYSQLLPGDDAANFTDLRLLQSDIIQPQVRKSGGNIIRWTGDTVLVEFESVVEAVRCAAALREAVSRLNQALRPERRIAVGWESTSTM